MSNLMPETTHCHFRVALFQANNHDLETQGNIITLSLTQLRDQQLAEL